MRVAFIHPFLFRYARGIERFTFNLANALARRKADVHLLTWHWSDPIRIDALDPRVHVREFPTSRYFAARAIVPFYTWDMIKNEYDFVWIFFAGYGEAEVLTLARRQKFGIVFHYPCAQVPHRYREFKRYGIVDRADKIVSVSQYVSEGVRDFFGRESLVIQHGVDSERFAPNAGARRELKASLQLLPNARVLVTAAALEERKGIQWVLRALPLVLKEFSNTHYLVLGDGTYQAALEALARELKIDDRVYFLGAQERVEPFYQAADVALILARGEASSLSALEALACGTPVIAAHRPPFDELIQSSYGMMVDEENPLQVAAAIIRLLENSSQARALGEAGRVRMIADFTWERAAEKYLQLISS